MVLKGILTEPSQCFSTRVCTDLPLSLSLWGAQTTNWTHAEARRAELHRRRSAYRSGFINHLVKDVDEDLVPDWLQAGSAVVPVGGAAKETVGWELKGDSRAFFFNSVGCSCSFHLNGSCRYWFQLGLGPSAVLVWSTVRWKETSTKGLTCTWITQTFAF